MAVIIVATIVPDVLGVNVAELCIEDGTILGGITGNHCGDASVFLTDAVKTIIGDGYSFLLVFIALAFIGIGAYKGVTYRILPSIPIEFFTKHSKLLAAVVILASIGTWSIVGNVAAIVVGLQHCDLFSDEETRSIIPIICYVLGQGQ